ncbi:ABC-type lipoprotein export system ATPase subunit [Aminobacter aminovorans]|nr:ABC-type lipoprotein export system ATPase subunit [Aminobacter aminovorans]
MFVYGANGAGKSSFVDGVEVCVSNGKVAHLAHEYSGRHQEKALINTHRPFGRPASVSVTMIGSGDAVTCTWEGTSAAKLSGLNKVPLNTWDYRRTALRQEEVAEFIRSTKAEKYSALLPLLGLQPLETAADNLRRIAKETATLSKIDDKRRQMTAVQVRTRAAFGEAEPNALIETLRKLRERYLPDQPMTGTMATVAAVTTAIDERLNTLDAQSREAAALQEIASNQLQELILATREVVAEIARFAEPLVKERLDILNAAARYSADIGGELEEVSCPACGSMIKPADFQAHVAAERDRLQNIDGLFRRRATAVGEVCDEVQRLRTLITGSGLAKWRIAHSESLAEQFAYLNGLNFPTLRTSCQEADLGQIETELGKVIAAATAASVTASPDVQALIKDKEAAETIDAVFAAEKTRERVERVEALIAYTNKLEELVRDEIREQAERVFGSISADIQGLWDILHPRQQITNVRLHVPGEADKAIDVALKFYGVDQESPRLTLSEGQRNALGLCIFLAMAKQGDANSPIILDDVVVSMDRGHRSKVATLLEKEFSDRQIILLTHDREWFFELSRFLRKPHWTSVRLLPWDGPAMGIRIADQSEDFAKARANVLTDPEDAESNVRRIMDQALAEIAERLEVPVPFLRGDENDHRTGGQLIGRISGRAKKSFFIRTGDQHAAGGEYAKHTTADASLDMVTPQLAAWANRATHTFSASPDEAKAVIDNCEAALSAFQCDSCGSPVWFCTIANSGNLECRCGKLQWRS